MDNKKKDNNIGMIHKNPNSQIPQFHSAWEPQDTPFNRDPFRPSQSLDESMGQALNKTFGGNSVNSTFYHWDQEDSFLLTDLEIMRHQQLQQQQRQQQEINRTNLNEKNTQNNDNNNNPAHQQLLATLISHTHKVNQINSNSNVPAGGIPQNTQCAENTNNNQNNPTEPFSNNHFGRDSYFSVVDSNFNINLHNNNINKLGDTVISEYVSEDCHCQSQLQQQQQQYSPVKEKLCCRVLPCVLESCVKDENCSNNDAEPKEAFKVRKDIQLLQILKDHELQKPVGFQRYDYHRICLNAIVVGAQGLGKSTFIDAFLHRKFKENSVIRQKTTEIIERQGVRKESKITLQLNFADTPGYQDDSQDEHQAWLEMVVGFIVSKFEAYHKREEQCLESNEAPSIHQEDDPRIHVCLFFLNGPRIQERDLQIMLKLQDYVNIIPVLAKGDCYTPEEVKAVKLQIVKDAHDRGIQWFDCETPLRNSPAGLAKIRDGSLGPAPPFLMISSVQKIEVSNNTVQYARKYPWGICRIEDPEHSDFLLLYQLLIGYFLPDLQKLTDYYFRKYLRDERKRLKSLKLAERQQKKQQNIVGGILTAIGLSAVIGYFTIKTK